MEPLHATVTDGFARYFEELLQRLHTWAEPVSEEQFWKKPYPYGNSFGHLVLHLTGNLSYYIGTEVAATGYIRDREREFGDPTPPSKAEALQRLNEAVAMVIETINNQSAEDWSKEYIAKGANRTKARFDIFLNCTAHFHHHIGQMIYLAKELSRQE